MSEQINQLINKRSTKKSEVSKKQVKKKIRKLLTNVFSAINAPGQLKGLDKVNQLILKKITELQALATDQLDEIATKLGVSGVESGDLSITIPAPSVNVEDLELPEIPADVPSPVKKLTISPVEVKVSEISTVSTLIGDQFTDQLLPLDFDSLEDSLKEEVLQELKPKAKELALSLINKKPPYCPTPEEGEKILKKYNSLLKVIEDISLGLNISSLTLNTITIALDVSLGAKSALNIAKIATNQAMKILPVTPGVIPSVITDVEDAVSLITFKADGTPILKDQKNGLEIGAFYLSMAAAVVNVILLILKLLKPLLETCGLEANEPGPETNRFVQEAETTNQSNTQQSYRGFTFEIVEVKLPNDPTVTRRIAQALNTEGIVALQTEPSFTQNPKVLIEELKLIIERDNLKAY
jgi:hypothetical protein|tara:strand:+ start:6734 stop:7966 length:1233 start_codon:yes stop_codon:yes gene_type:complete